MSPRTRVALVVAGLAALAAVGVIHAHAGGAWNRNLSALSPISKADQRIDAQLRNDLGAPSGDPMSTLRRLNELIYYAFDYEVGITEVHSPIEHALREERGVC